MNANYKISSTPMMSSIDMCGREVLGMSGSLINYINTGNPYGCDSFNRPTDIVTKEPKNKKKLVQVLKWGITGVTLVAAGIYVFKKKPSFEEIKNLPNKVFQFLKGGFEKIGNKFKKTKP